MCLIEIVTQMRRRFANQVKATIVLVAFTEVLGFDSRKGDEST